MAAKKNTRATGGAAAFPNGAASGAPKRADAQKMFEELMGSRICPSCEAAKRKHAESDPVLAASLGHEKLTEDEANAHSVFGALMVGFGCRLDGRNRTGPQRRPVKRKATRDREPQAPQRRDPSSGNGELNPARVDRRDVAKPADADRRSAAQLAALQQQENDAQLAGSRGADRPAFVDQALAWLAQSAAAGQPMGNPQDVQDFLRLKLGKVEHEVFGLIFLDSQHRVLSEQEMFRGTLMQANVYPREVVKEALRLNAGAVICYHNHPSGSPEPSMADETLTSALSSALAVVDVRLLDHLIVGSLGSMSFAERRLL